MKPSELLPDHLAEALGRPPGLLRRIANDTSRHYKPTRIVTVRGKPREIDPPTWEFKQLMRLLHRFLQRHFPAHSAAHGCVKRKSCFTAAARHLGKSFVATRDIQDCYPSISTAALKSRLQKLGFRRDTSWLLAHLMTHRGKIPQGSPTSGDALNLFLYDADERLSDLSRDWADATRTADDIVISFNDSTRKEEAGRIIESEIVGHGLRVSEKKKQRNGFQSAASLQLVHAIGVNSARGTSVSPDHQATAIDVGLQYVRNARLVSAESLEGVAKLRQQLHGWMHYCRQAHFSPARYLNRLLRQGDRLVSQRLCAAFVSRSQKWWVTTKKLNRPKELADLWRRNTAKKRSDALDPLPRRAPRDGTVAPVAQACRVR